MTDKDRKLLTEFLDECWHEMDLFSRVLVQKHNLSHFQITCRVCGYVWVKQASPIGNYDSSQLQRSFDTWQDLGDLKEKLVDKGLHDQFSFYAEKQLDGIPGPSGNRRRFDDWLLNPRRFYQLVADYLKEK